MKALRAISSALILSLATVVGVVSCGVESPLDQGGDAFHDAANTEISPDDGRVAPRVDTFEIADSQISNDARLDAADANSADVDLAVDVSDHDRVDVDLAVDASNHDPVDVDLTTDISDHDPVDVDLGYDAEADVRDVLVSDLIADTRDEGSDLLEWDEGPPSQPWCEDGLACTLNVVDLTGTCGQDLRAGWCLIGGICYRHGVIRPYNQCQRCDATTDSEQWTSHADGTGCHGDLECRAGACQCPDGYVRIPAGSFIMGMRETEPGFEPAVGWIHQVTLTRTFCMKETEVTQGEWKDITGENPSSFPACGDDCPVTDVNWWNTLWFANTLSEKHGLQACYQIQGFEGYNCTGKPGETTYCVVPHFAGLDCDGYRLPTEAEWEYAARAGTNAATYNVDVAGGTIDSDHLACEQPNPVLDPIAWFCGNSSVAYEGSYDCSSIGGPPACGPRPVKGRRANPWGLFDMLGNVLEWCWDQSDSSYYYNCDAEDPCVDPLGGEHVTANRVLRGGSWRHQAKAARVNSKTSADRQLNDSRVGFRLVRSISGP